MVMKIGGLDRVLSIPGNLQIQSNTVVSSGAFVPTDISGIQLWLDADDISTLWTTSARSVQVASDGDPVGAWDDKSGLANHCTQATSTKRPTYKTSIQNSLPIVRSDGTDDILDFADVFSSLTTVEVFIVVAAGADPQANGADGVVWDFTTAANSTHYTFTDGTLYDNFGTTVRKTAGNPTPSMASFRIYNVVSASGEWTNFIDTTQFFTTGTNTVGIKTAPSIFGNTGTGGNFLGDIGEIIIYDSKLSAGNKTSVETYLNDKWATF